jgi:hypothetical protein
MALKRRLYSTQSLTIGGNAAFPVKNFSISRERPMEPILGLGLLKGYDQAQKGFETFKFDVKCFLPKSAQIDVTVFKTMCTNAEIGTYTSFQVTPAANGTPVLKGAITNISLDNTVGEFIELGLSFQGIGNPNVTDTGADISAAPTDAGGVASNVEVYDSSAVTISSDYGDTVKSAKFSFEMPIETIAHLGGKIADTNLNLTQGTNLNKVRLIAKAPYKASLSFDGTSVKARADTNNRGGTLPTITFGNLPFDILNGALKSFSINQSPGEIGAAYSASYEGTHVDQLKSP